MSDDKDDLPSDAEKSGLKPIAPGDRTPSPPPPKEDRAEDDRVESDPSEQPS